MTLGEDGGSAEVEGHDPLSPSIDPTYFGQSSINSMVRSQLEGSFAESFGRDESYRNIMLSGLAPQS